MEYKNTVGEQIKRSREAANMTQFQLAIKSGVNPQIISNYERGKVEEPRLTTVVCLARALGVSVDCLSGNTDVSDSVAMAV